MPLAEDTSISRVLINLVFGRIYFDGAVGFYVCIFTGRSNAAHKEPSSFRVVVFCRGVLVVDVYIGVLMCLRLLGFCVRVIIEGPSGLPLCR